LIIVKGCSDRDLLNQWTSVLETYWEGDWWQNRGFLEQNITNKTFSLGKAATSYSSVISHSKSMRNNIDQEETLPAGKKLLKAVGKN
jgi:hypothetical protein